MDQRLTFNGIDLNTGTYALPPMTIESFARRVLATKAPANLGELKARARAVNEPHYAPVAGVDTKDLAQTGWGVIFPFDHDPAIREALGPLLDLRRAQATRVKNLYREIGGQDGYRGGEHAELTDDFLGRFDADGGGAVDPEQLPYYLLLVGSPEQIPFRFQYQLDVQYAVGRIHYDHIDDYARYAEAVVAAETVGQRCSRRAAFFGTANHDDGATEMSSTQLVTPLADLMRADQPLWTVETIVGTGATKARLSDLLGGSDTPALLFTASHGLCVPHGDPQLVAMNGALVCQDWLGPTAGRMSPEQCFGGDDVASDARLRGLISFHFACFSGGTPARDDFPDERGKAAAPLADRPFVAHLPQRLLRGGALAAVGHVDRAWTCSFKTPKGSAQLRVFKSALKCLMEGHPVGSALEFFNNRYAGLEASLSDRIDAANAGGYAPDPNALANQWLWTRDARNYTVAGDPAVRLFSLDAPAEQSDRRPTPAVEVRPAPVARSSARADGKKSWAVLAYTVADHKAGGSAIDATAERELAAMCRAADFNQLSLAAQVDLTNSAGVYRGVLTSAPDVSFKFEEIQAASHRFWRRVDAKLERSTLRVLEEKDDLNSARGHVLKRFLRFGQRECPADRYVVFFYGHATGPLGLFFDNDSNEGVPIMLGLPALADSLASTEGRAAIVVFRDCLMNTLETAYELRGSAEFMVATQSLAPIAGVWPWHTFLTALMPDAPSGQAAKAIAQQLAHFLTPFENRNPYSDVPYSVIDIGAADAIVGPLKSLADALETARGDRAREAACASALEGAREGHPDTPARPGDPSLLDVPTLCDNLGALAGDPVEAPAKALGAVVRDQLVTWHHSLQGRHRGVSLYYEPTGPDPKRSSIFEVELKARDGARYKRLALSQATGWDRIALNPFTPTRVRPTI